MFHATSSNCITLPSIHAVVLCCAIVFSNNIVIVRADRTYFTTVYYATAYRRNTELRAKPSVTFARSKCTRTNGKSVRARYSKTTSAYPRHRTLIGGHFLGFTTAKETRLLC